MHRNRIRQFKEAASLHSFCAFYCCALPIWINQKDVAGFLTSCHSPPFVVTYATKTTRFTTKQRDEFQCFTVHFSIQ